MQLVCMQTQCSIIELALLQTQDVIVNDASRFDQLRSVSVLATNYERNLGGMSDGPRCSESAPGQTRRRATGE